MGPFHRPATSIEQRTGRFLALCVHPMLAWRLSSRRTRIAIVTAYAVAAYGTVLTALVVAMPS